MRTIKTIVFILSALLAQACASNASPGDSRLQVDLIMAGDTVITMDDAQPLIEQGAVAIKDGMIVAVDSADRIDATYRAAERVAGDGRVLMPGLINGHGHAAMTVLRGLADDLELFQWLNDYMFPAERQFTDAEFVRIGTELACWEMMRGGTTTFVDMYYYPDTVAKVVESCGLRALVGPTIIDHKSPDANGFDQGLAQASDFVRRWKGKNNRVIPILAPHAIYTLSPEQMTIIGQRAEELGVAISVHLAESPFEIDIVRERYDDTPINIYESIDFFSGSHVIGAHVVWPTDKEIEILARRGVGAIHCPTSNMKISSGVSPVPKMLAAGVKVGIGTDGPASNNDIDMWEEMRLVSFLHKADTLDPKVLPAQQVLRMATLGGAEAIGLADELGALTVGRRADMIQIDWSDPHFLPTYDVVSQLIYVADEQDVSTVVVDGTVIMRDKKILTIDQDRLRKEVGVLNAKIKAALVDK